VRGQGGDSARWLADATMAADAVIAEQARAYGVERSARWGAARSLCDLHGWPGSDEVAR